MAANGYAWRYKSYGKERQDLARAEQEARIVKKGIGATENPEAPWDYRAKQKKKPGSRKKK
jgi:endonuclease YncB( thermonuclease family)